MDERPHDILAAEEFSVPAEDPALHVEPAHDVLAAEEFSLPGEDVTLHHGPATVPEPASGGGDPPHDVLAAEEFAVPAGRGRVTAISGRRSRRAALLTATLGCGVALLWRRHR